MIFVLLVCNVKYDSSSRIAEKWAMFIMSSIYSNYNVNKYVFTCDPQTQRVKDGISVEDPSPHCHTHTRLEKA